MTAETGECSCLLDRGSDRCASITSRAVGSMVAVTQQPFRVSASISFRRICASLKR
jgi:hypothetical protein